MASNSPRSRINQEKGLWLVEVFSVVYKGYSEVTPENQIGTIKVNDGVRDHYLYNVKGINQCKSSIQHLDELELTAPQVATISGKGSLTVDVELFSGAFKGSFNLSDCPSEDSVEVYCPMEIDYSLKSDFGMLHVLYAIYDNATEARIKIKILPDNFDDKCTEVYGVVSASTSKIDATGYRSLLFAKKPSDKIKLASGKLFPLSRSIVAVPLDSELFLDINLSMGDEAEYFEGTVSFPAKRAKRSSTHKKLLKGKQCKIEVKVIWKGSGEKSSGRVPENRRRVVVVQ